MSTKAAPVCKKIPNFFAPRLLTGFTLIELMLVVFIITIITAIVLSSNNKFNSAILLRSFAYEVGLAVREAQLYGISTKGVGAAFSPVYGLEISGTPATVYTLFADVNGDDQFTPGDGSAVDTFTAQHGFYISQICVTQSGGAQTCLTSGQSLDILFKRPDPSAIIVSSGSTCQKSDPCTDVIITVSSPAGSTRTVEVANTGLITVAGTEN